jgi:dynein heavy chain 1
VQACLKRTLNSFNPEEMHQEPAERGRMYLLVAWLHAVLQERLRYTPLGWSKKYAFGEPDLQAAILTVNQWMTQSAKGKSNLPPDKIPFQALRELLATAVYGGRVDNDIDMRLLAAFVDSIFTPKAFDETHQLVPVGPDGSAAICVPAGTKRDQFLVWANSLPDKEQPFWVGLPNNAQRVLKQQAGAALVRKILTLQTADEDVAVIEAVGEATATTASWMLTMQELVGGWLERLPEELVGLEVTDEAIKNPMFRFYNREITIMSLLLTQVREDVESVLAVCNGR